MLLAKTIGTAEKLIKAAKRLMSARVLSTFVSLSALMGTTHCAGSFPNDGKDSVWVLAYGLLNQCGNLSLTGTSFSTTAANAAANQLNFNLRSYNPLCNQLSSLGSSQQSISVNGNNNVPGTLVATGSGFFRLEVPNNGYWALGQTNVPYSLDLSTMNAGSVKQSGVFDAQFFVNSLISITPSGSGIDPHGAVRARFRVTGVSNINSLPGAFTITTATFNGMDASAYVTIEAKTQNPAIADDEIDVVMQNVQSLLQWYVGHGIPVNVTIIVSHVGLNGTLTASTFYVTATDVRTVPTLSSASPINGSSVSPVATVSSFFSTGTAGQASSMNITYTHTATGGCAGTFPYPYAGSNTPRLTLIDLGGGNYRLDYTPLNGAGAVGGLTCAATNNQQSLQFTDGPFGPGLGTLVHNFSSP